MPTYVLNKGQHTYTSSGGTYVNSQTNVSINPIVHNQGLSQTGYEANLTLNFYEIRNDSGVTTTGLIGDTDYFGAGSSAVYNRVLPTGTTANNFVSNPEKTQSYRLKIPEGTSLTLDPTYDYFVVIYSEGTDYKKHRRQTHIAKITDIVMEDVPDRINNGTTYGDSFDFSPKNSYENLENMKYMIFKGPKTADTSVVSVGYGLIGVDESADPSIDDTRLDGTTQNLSHDIKTIISSPTHYFYKERLDNKEQLKHSTKYRLSRARFYTTTYKEISTSVFLTCSAEGNRIKDSSKYSYTINLVDKLQVEDRAINASSLTYEFNKTSFSTEKAHYTANHTNWDAIFKNSKRGLTNRNSNLIGPDRYTIYKPSPKKCNVLPHLVSCSVFTSITKSGTYAEVRYADPNRILNKKILEYESLKVHQKIYDNDMVGTANALLPGLASKQSNTTIRISNLEGTQDITTLIKSGGNYEFIRIKDTLYLLSNITALTLSGNSYYQDLTVTHFMNIKGNSWTSISALESFTNEQYFRRRYSSICNNLVVDFEPNNDYINDLEMIIHGGHYSGKRITFSSGNASLKSLVPNNLPSSLYQPSGSNYLNYLSGNSVFERNIFDGSVEYMEDYMEDGQLYYLATGRDIIYKFLGPIINENYLHASDYVYSSTSPVNDIGVTAVIGARVISAFTVIDDCAVDYMFPGTTRIYCGASPASFNEGDAIYTNDGRLIGEAKVVAVQSGTGGTHNLVNSLNFASKSSGGRSYNGYIDLVSPTCVYYNMDSTAFAATDGIWANYRPNLISGLGITTNDAAIPYADNIATSSERGLVFTSGKQIALNPLTETFKNLTEKNAIDDKAFSNGYDISKIRRLNGDNPFVFKLANDKNSGGTSTTDYYHVDTVSGISNFNVHSVSSSPNSNTSTITLSATSPLVLGAMFENSLDTRYSNSAGLYLLNKHSLNEGGFIGHVNNRLHQGFNSLNRGIHTWIHDCNKHGEPLYRYTDLQRGSFTLKTTYDENNAYNNESQLNNYAVIFGLKGGIDNNTVVTYDPFIEVPNFNNLAQVTPNYRKVGPPSSRGFYPVLGSNFADFNYYDGADLKYVGDGAGGNDCRTWPSNFVGTNYVFTLNETAIAYDPVTLLKKGNYSGNRTCTFIRPNTTLSYFTGNTTALPNKTIDDAKYVLENFDTKCINYHIFSPADTELDYYSHNRRLENKKFPTEDELYSFTDFNVVLMGETLDQETSISHSKFSGIGASLRRSNLSYETLPISGSSINPNELSRFSLGRLVEIGFDFHFNLIDLENPSFTNIATSVAASSNYFKYSMDRWPAKTPIKIMSTLSVNDTTINVSEASWFTDFIHSGSNTNHIITYLFNSTGQFIGIVKDHTKNKIKDAEGLAFAQITGLGSYAGSSTYATTTNGRGSGLTVTLTGDGSGGIATAVTAVEPTNTRYSLGDTVTIAQADITTVVQAATSGSETASGDLVITLAASDFVNSDGSSTINLLTASDSADMLDFGSNTYGIAPNNHVNSGILYYKISNVAQITGSKAAAATGTHLYAYTYYSSKRTVPQYINDNGATFNGLGSTSITIGGVSDAGAMVGVDSEVNKSSSGGIRYSTCNSGDIHPDNQSKFHGGNDLREYRFNIANDIRRDFKYANLFTKDGGILGDKINLLSAKFKNAESTNGSSNPTNNNWRVGKDVYGGTAFTGNYTFAEGTTGNDNENRNTGYEHIPSILIGSGGIYKPQYNSSAHYSESAILDDSYNTAGYPLLYVSATAYSKVRILDKVTMAGRLLGSEDWYIIDKFIISGQHLLLPMGNDWTDDTNWSAPAAGSQTMYLYHLEYPEFCFTMLNTDGNAVMPKGTSANTNYGLISSPKTGGSGNSDETERLWVPLAFIGHVPFDDNYQHMKMLSHAGHLITPYHDAPYYDIGDIHTGNNSMYRDIIDSKHTDNIKKWPSSAMEFECAELKSTTRTVNNASGYAADTVTITVSSTTGITVGNYLYVMDTNWSTNDNHRPIPIGEVTEVTDGTTLKIEQKHSAGTGSDAGIQNALKHDDLLYVVAGVPHIYWQPSRIIHYLSKNQIKATQYGYYKNDTSPHYIHNGGLFNEGKFVFLKSDAASTASTGSSFMLNTYVQPSDQWTGGCVQSDKYAWATHASGNSWTSYRLIYNTSQYTATWPIFDIAIFQSPKSVDKDLQTQSIADNTNNNMDGHIAFKPEFFINTDTNDAMTVTNAGLNYSVADFDANDILAEYKNDVRKIVINNKNGSGTVCTHNHWLHYAPNMTGYYLVNMDDTQADERHNSIAGAGIRGTTSTINFYGHTYRNHKPKSIHQIIKHEISYDADGSMIHSLWVDNDANNDKLIDNSRFKVMKLAENCTYSSTPKDIELYNISSQYTKKSDSTQLYGPDKISDFTLEEPIELKYDSMSTDAVKSMYVILDADPETSNASVISEYTLVRDYTKFIHVAGKIKFGNRYSFGLTDGENTWTSGLYVNTISKEGRSDTFPVLEFDTMKASKGLLSLGSLFTIDVPFVVRGNYDNAKICSTFNIGTKVDDVINDLMDKNNIEYTALDDVDKYIFTGELKGGDLYNSLVFAGSFQNIRPHINGQEVSFRKIDNIENAKSMSITEGIEKVTMTKKEKTLLEIKNQVYVYGRGVVGEARDTKSIRKHGLKTLEEVDLSISTEKQAEERAINLLRQHSADNLMIEIELGITGVENIKAGQKIFVDYPIENIPVGNYLVVQVDHHIGKPLKLTLGKYNQNLEYRIAELIATGKKVNANLRATNYSYPEYNTIETTMLIKPIRLEIIEESTTGTFGSTSGFTTTFGFMSPFGFTTTTAATTETQLYEEDF